MQRFNGCSAHCVDLISNVNVQMTRTIATAGPHGVVQINRSDCSRTRSKRDALLRLQRSLPNLQYWISMFEHPANNSVTGLVIRYHFYAQLATMGCSSFPFLQ